MHAPDDDKPGPTREVKDPLSRVPPAGRWTLFHGDLAAATIALGYDRRCGRAAAGPDFERAPPLKDAGLSPPLADVSPARVIEQGEGEERRAFLVLPDAAGCGYESCYVVGLGAAAAGEPRAARPSIVQG